MPRPLLVLLALAVLAPLGGCGDDEPAADDPLVERLRDGGLVLLFRHATTDSATDMTADLSDCSRQRNLDASGRRQSRTVGAEIRALQVPIGVVLASPFCRTRETARLAFGSARASRALLSPKSLATPSRSPLRRLLIRRPAQKTNTVLVSHEAAIDAATGTAIEEGDALVVRPGRKPRVLRHLSPHDWAALK